MSQTDIIINELMRLRGEWVAMPHLAQEAGCYAVHSRCAEGRKRGITIENRVDTDPETKVKKSYYRIP